MKGQLLDARTVAGLPLARDKGRDVIYFDSQLIGLGLRVRKAGKRTWVLVYRNRVGQQRRLTIGNADALAVDVVRRIAKQHIGEVASGNDPQAEKAQARTAHRNAAHF